MKSRMRKNRTSGSVRGSRQAFHVYKYPERSVETVYSTDPMNKESLGAFIAENRKRMDLTQKDLAVRLHVTDKAVSKWERGLSYPDVTLLEPLAAVFDLSVEELMSCQRRERNGEEETMKALLDISRDSVKAERRRGWSRLIGVLALLAVTVLAILCAVSYRSVQDDSGCVVQLKETVNGENFLYIVEPWNDDHLLRLKCGGDVDFDAIQLTDERGDQISYWMSYRWNRWTRQGVVTACEPFGIVLGGMPDMTFEQYCEPLFGYPEVFFCFENYYQDPYSESERRVFLCDVRLWVEKNGQSLDKGMLNTVVDGGSPYPEEIKKTILLVEDCLMAAPWDWDGDGENEVVARTRWVEKPYTVYDMVDGEIVTSWPDTVPEDLAERLMTDDEREEQYRQMVRAAQGHGSGEAEPDGGDPVL